MNSKETLNRRERIKIAACKGQLIDIKRLSYTFSDDVRLLSEILIQACATGYMDVVKWMVEHTAADVNYSTPVRRLTIEKLEDKYHTPLSAACHGEHLDVVKYLVETSRVDVNLRDSTWGYTPLIEVCRSANLSISMYLLREVSDLDVNIASYRGDTALHFAVWCNKDDGYTRLHRACMADNKTEVLRLLYMSGHVINVQDNSGFTPLHWACHYGLSDTVETLMLAGADETITNNDSLTPAQLAERMGHTELLKLLDRDSLWEAMLGRQRKLKLWPVLLILLTVKLLRQKLVMKNWSQIITVVHVGLTVRSIINFNRIKRYKQKRKTNCTV